MISDKQRKIEIAAVFITGAGKFLFMDFLQWKLPFILFAITAWASYVIYRSKKVPGILKYWGFRMDTFKDVTLRILPYGIFFIAAFFIVGYIRGTINMTWHIIPILILYPIWGVIQQFLVIALVAGNLQDHQENKLSK